jgi:hypothetical protein
MSGHVPYEPLNEPKPVAPEVWIVDGPEVAFGYLGVKLPFPTRMTVVRLPDGGLWLHSPVALDTGLVSRLLALGPVRFLIAPNTLHYSWMGEWRARFPDAQAHGVPGLEKHAARMGGVVQKLTGEAPAAWAGTIDQLVLSGPALTEAAFFHRPSRTLILTDLIENFEPKRVKNPIYRQLVKAAGAADPDGKAPLDMQLSFASRQTAVLSAARRMIEWRPERVIMAHGRWYESNGTAELRRAFRWVL